MRRPGASRPVPLDIEALYARHRDELLHFLVRRTADTQVALDLWAETFALAVAGRARFRGVTEEEAAGWLYGIARRQLALYYRRGSTEGRALARLGLERPPADARLASDIERRAGLDVARGDLIAALATLSEPVRSAVHLRVVDELSYPELATRLQISEPAARARVSRGLAALADVLDPIPLKEQLSS